MRELGLESTTLAIPTVVEIDNSKGSATISQPNNSAARRMVTMIATMHDG